MPASLMALADELYTANDDFRDTFTRGSHLSSPSCDSVQIHRSALAFEALEKMSNGRGVVPRTTDHQTDILTAAFPRLVVAESECIADDLPANSEDTGRGSSTDSRVQWTTPEGIQGQLKAALTNNMDGKLAPDIRQRKPFHKWVKALSRRRIARRHLRRLEKSDQTQSEKSNRVSRSSVSRRNSSSISSFAYVSAARDASISGAGTSLAPSSRRHQARSSKRLSKTDRSSRASCSARQSEDDQLRTQAELETLERSKHRRRIIEELMETEEGYIGDVKFLMKAYLTLFASSSLADPGFRLSMYSSLTDIVEIHDQILGSLHRAVPNSEYIGIPPMGSSRSSPSSKMQRRRSLDVVPEDRPKGLPLYEHSGLSAGPQTAGAVANIFTNIKNKLSVYEEYGAKYGMVMDDLKMMYRSNPHWEKHQRGLENLASMLSYPRAPSGIKRALSIGDLFAKPIQRACRYPLLFRELLKATPVYDCPHAHVEIEKALGELESVAKAMNEATDDPLIKSTLQKTWLLQERLRFPFESTGGTCRSRVRSFGRIELCGVLHVCWQSESSVDGKYMVVILYRSWLCLATVDRPEKRYTLRACIPLHNSSVEEADNGRGLQCHSAPYSWKIAFECNRQLYEILMTAGNQTEQREWTRRLDRHSIDGNSPIPGDASFEFLDLDMKFAGTVFGYHGTAKRKPSMRRMTTMPMPKAAMCQVILNNTCTGTETTKATLKYASIKRSKSVQVDSRIPVLSPPRGERAQLESLIADVWTRDIILCTGLAARPKLGHHRRPSASSIIRRMSVVSLTGTFSRKSAPTSSFRAFERAEQEIPRQAQPTGISSTARDHLDFKPHDGQTKTGQVGVTVHERTSSDVSTSFDRPREHSYFLTGTSEQMAYSLQQRRNQPGSAATVANVPRSSVTHFIEEMGPHRVFSARRTDGEAHSEVPVSPSMPDLSHHGSLSTAEMSMTSSTANMMSPLTQQSGHASSTRQGRHWLGRPLLHRKSFRRAAKETQH